MFDKHTVSLISVLFLTLAVGCGGSSEAPAGDATKPAPAPKETAKPAPASGGGTAGAMGTASISGVIRYDGAIPNLRPVQMDADPGCAKKHTEDVMPEILVLGDGNSLANVLVYVKNGGGGYAAPAEKVVLNQEGCRYTPHVVSLQTEQTFKILNSDGLLHNVHGLPKLNTAFNQAMPAAVTEAEYSFDKEEIFKIKCDVHPWMGAWVGVFSHPFHGVTGTDGTFSIESLPAGTYDLEAHHERLGTLTASVTVADGGSGVQDFVFVKN